MDSKETTITNNTEIVFQFLSDSGDKFIVYKDGNVSGFPPGKMLHFRFDGQSQIQYLAGDCFVLKDCLSKVLSLYTPLSMR